MKKILAEYPKQDATELESMADFYKKQYPEVWFVRCLQCMRIMAVEVSTVGGNIPDRNRQIFGYQGLFMTTRNRLDTDGQGGYMVGYECACGNDTRLGKHEQGHVQTHTIVKNKEGNVVSADEPIRALSPFEKSQLEATIRINQASATTAPDYENKGNVVRYETFQLERV